MKYQVSYCIFHINLAMATLGMKEMGKFLWEGREKVLPCWLSQFSKTRGSPTNAKIPHLHVHKPKTVVVETVLVIFV